MREGDNAFLVEQLEVYFDVTRTCWGQRNANKRNMMQFLLMNLVDKYKNFSRGSCRSCWSVLFDDDTSSPSALIFGVSCLNWVL